MKYLVLLIGIIKPEGDVQEYMFPFDLGEYGVKYYEKAYAQSMNYLKILEQSHT